MTTITGQGHIDRFRLLAQRGAVKLEKLGMKRSGRSATSRMKEKYNLPKNASYDTVLDCINKELETLS